MHRFMRIRAARFFHDPPMMLKRKQNNMHLLRPSRGQTASEKILGHRLNLWVFTTMKERKKKVLVKHSGPNKAKKTPLYLTSSKENTRLSALPTTYFKQRQRK